MPLLPPLTGLFTGAPARGWAGRPLRSLSGQFIRAAPTSSLSMRAAVRHVETWNPVATHSLGTAGACAPLPRPRKGVSSSSSSLISSSPSPGVARTKQMQEMASSRSARWRIATGFISSQFGVRISATRRMRGEPKSFLERCDCGGHRLLTLIDSIMENLHDHLSE